MLQLRLSDSRRATAFIDALMRSTLRLECVAAGGQSDAWLETIVGQPRDLFRYTSGRWLWNEEERFQERYRVFNIRELQNVASEAASSGPCIRLEKMHEDLYDKTFKLTMADGKTLIARIPYRNFGAPSLATASKVATLEFLRTVLRLPVPKVLAWNAAADVTNPVGAEYVIMELPSSDNLADVWTKTSLEVKKQTVKDVVEIQRKLLSIKFLGYGCLFFTKDAPPGSRPVTITGSSLSSETRQRVAKRFSIGPMVTPEYWRGERAKLDIDRGPWPHPLKYIQAPAHRELAWFANYAKYYHRDHPTLLLRIQYSHAYLTETLRRYLQLTPFLLPKDESFLASYLWHRDFYLSNMFIDDQGHITDIIDWPNTYTRPLYFENNIAPHFIHPSDEPGYTLLSADELKSLNADAASAPLDKRSNVLLLHAFDKFTKERSPLLARMAIHPNRDTRRLPFCHASNLWKGDAMDLLLSFVSVQKHWRELFRKADCPFTYSGKDLPKLVKEQEKRMLLWNNGSGILTKEGWTSNENYIAAKLFLDNFKRTSGPKVKQWWKWFL
ncbi:phosphotransferase family protein [Aspergillus insuetus]